MSTPPPILEVATIGHWCKVLHLPAVGPSAVRSPNRQCGERRTHLGFLEALLQAELEEREQRLIPGAFAKRICRELVLKEFLALADNSLLHSLGGLRVFKKVQSTNRLNREY
jgi:hypothetical protein